MTPDSPGAGLRLRGILFEKRSDRIFVSTLVLYYPASQASSDEPWVLAWPTVLAEHRFAAMTTTREGSWGRLGQRTIGGAIPIARATTLFSDISVMSQGLAFDRHWLGTLPVVVTAGVEQTL